MKLAFLVESTVFQIPCAILCENEANLTIRSAFQSSYLNALSLSYLNFHMKTVLNLLKIIINFFPTLLERFSLTYTQFKASLYIFLFVYKLMHK